MSANTNVDDLGTIKQCLINICGAQNYTGGSVDRASLWNLSLAVSTIALVVVTAFLWKVAKQQLGGISKTSKAEFIMKFTNTFFSETTRTLIMLLEYNALLFNKKLINIGESKPKAFLYFYTDDAIVNQMNLSSSELSAIRNRIYNAYEIDHFLLNPFEDIGLFEKNGLLDMEDIYSGFSWYVDLIWNHPVIQEYINYQKREPMEDTNGELTTRQNEPCKASDLYDNFKYIAEKCASYEMAKKRNISNSIETKPKGRLQFFNGGKEYYLDYLRNLGPQVLLLTIIWLAATRFEFSFDLNNFFSTLIYLILIFSFLLAVYANGSHFNGRCFAELHIWEAEQKKLLAAQGINGCRRSFEMIKAILKHKFIEYTEFFIFVFIIQITLSVVIITSLNSAVNIWQNNHRAVSAPIKQSAPVSLIK